MSSINFQSGTTISSVWLDEVDSASFQYLAAVGGTNTITAQGPLSYTAYTQQAGFILNPQNTSTGAVTLNINGLGAKAVTKYGTTPLVSGDILVGTLAYVIYDGVRFQLLNPQSQDLRIAFTGRLLNVQTFTANGTYTPTSGMVTCIVEMVGGGGAGGGSQATGGATVSVGTGGGSGAYSKARFTAAQISGSQIVTVGAGGAGVSGATGGAGGTSSLGALLTAPGGGGGTPGVASAVCANAAAGAGGAVGVVGGGGTSILLVGGNPGMNARSDTTGGGFSGSGACSTWGGGGVSSTAATANGVAASANSGSGGSGGIGFISQPATTGGAGAAGRLIIYEYS